MISFLKEQTFCKDVMASQLLLFAPHYEQVQPVAFCCTSMAATTGMRHGSWLEPQVLLHHYLLTLADVDALLGVANPLSVEVVQGFVARGSLVCCYFFDGGGVVVVVEMQYQLGPCPTFEF